MPLTPFLLHPLCSLQPYHSYGLQEAIVPYQEPQKANIESQCHPEAIAEKNPRKPRQPRNQSTFEGQFTQPFIVITQERQQFRPNVPTRNKRITKKINKRLTHNNSNHSGKMQQGGQLLAKWHAHQSAAQFLLSNQSLSHNELYMAIMMDTKDQVAYFKDLNHIRNSQNHEFTHTKADNFMPLIFDKGAASQSQWAQTLQAIHSNSLHQ